MMEPYANGTAAATKFLSEKFQKQIEILIQKEIEEQRISMKNKALLEKSGSS